MRIHKREPFSRIVTNPSQISRCFRHVPRVPQKLFAYKLVPIEASHQLSKSILKSYTMVAADGCSVVEIAPFPSPGRDLLKHTCSSEDLTVKTVDTEGEMALSDSTAFHHHDTHIHLNLVEDSETTTSSEFDAGLDIDG